MPLSELRELLSIKKSQYKLVGHLKSRLLEPSISLINRVTDIKVSCSSYKHGRRIAGFVFDIKKGAPKVLVECSSNPSIPNKHCTPNEITSESQSLEQKYNKLGITTSEFNILLKKL